MRRNSPKSYHRTSSTTRENVSKSSVLPVSERYQFIERLGEGGYGEVFRALDRVTKKEVAIKLPHTDGGDEKLPEANEIDILARFHHPNLMHLIDCLYDTDSKKLLIVLPLGRSLKRYLEEKRERGESLSLGKCKSILFQLASAIHFLHSTNHYFHCDIKTDNIILVDGKVKLADFGLAFPDNQVNNAKTRCGTVGYASPQTLRTFKEDAKYDPSFPLFDILPEAGESPVSLIQSDIYALGSVLFECMKAGFPLVEFDNLRTTIVQNYHDVPVRVQNESFGAPTEDQKEWEELRRLVLRMVAPSQADRMQSISEIFSSPLFNGDMPIKGHVNHIKMEGFQIPKAFAQGKSFDEIWTILFGWLDEVQLKFKVNNSLQVMCLAMDLFMRVHEIIPSYDKIQGFGCVCLALADSIINSETLWYIDDWVNISNKSVRNEEFIDAYLHVIGYLHGKLFTDNVCNFSDNAYFIFWYIKKAMKDCTYVTKSVSSLLDEFSKCKLGKKEPVSLASVASHRIGKLDCLFKGKGGESIKFSCEDSDLTPIDI